MKTSSRHPLNAAVVPRYLGLLVACVLVVDSGNAAEAVLDFRTLIPGILDVPVFRADGTNRLSGNGDVAVLFAGVSPSHLIPIGAARPFGTGDKAGYIWAEDPVPVVVPGARPGDRIWVKMLAWEPSRLGHVPEDFPPDRFRSESDTFSLIISNTPTPLIGLKSFAFQAAPLQISRQGGEVVLRWSAGDGTLYYNVETTSALGVPGSWRPSGRSPVMDRRSIGDGLGSWWYADWVMTNTVTETAAFYRIILLNP